MFGKFFKAKGKLYLCSLFALCAVLLCCATFAFCNIFGAKNTSENNSQKTISASAENTVPIDWTPSERANTTVSGGKITISGTCADMAAGWKAAIDASTSSSTQITVILGNDWIAADEIAASNGTVVNTSFGEGEGYFIDKMLYVPEGKNIKIDLKGHSINRNLKTTTGYRVPAPVANGGCIKVVGSKLEIDDSTGTDNGLITGGYTTAQGAVFVYGTNSGTPATFTLRHGNITENESQGGLAGAGLRLGGGESGASNTTPCYFYMYGGKITNNKIPTYYGGGIFARQFVTIEMTGGEISGNIASHGGGVCLYADTSTLKMSGSAKIINNEAVNYGGGIALMTDRGNQLPNLEVNGGEISGNKAGTYGGGICVSDDNFTYKYSAGTIKNNTALRTGQDFCIFGGRLAWSKAVGYALGGMTTTPIGFLLANDWVADDIVIDGELVNTSLSGTFDVAEEDANITTTPFFRGALCVPPRAKIILDLNGHVINRNIKVSSAIQDTRVPNPTDACSKHGRVVYLNNSELEIMDTGSGNGQIRGGYISGENHAGAGIWGTDCKLTISGGNITCNEVVCGDWNSWAGAGIRLDKTSTFLMTGGEISYNSIPDYYAGALFVRDTTTAIMTGGKIHHNVGKLGGAVCAYLGHFQMSGGTISDNEAEEGGGVYTQAGSSQFTMTGGTITNNKATRFGGGVVHYGTAINISGNAQILGNTLTDGTRNNVHLSQDKKVTIAGLFTGSVGITMSEFNTAPYTFTTGFGSSSSTHQAANYEKARFFSDTKDASGKYYNITSAGSGTSKEAVISAGTATTIPVPKPVGRTVEYDGTSQMIIIGYDASGMTASNATSGITPENGTYSITNVGVGTYSVKFTLKSGYVWADNTTGAITVTGYMTKAQISVAWKTSSLTRAFTGGEQQPEIQSTSCNVAGTSESWFIVNKYADSGTYTAKATLKNGSGGDNGTTNYQANYCTSISGSGSSIKYGYEVSTQFRINGAEITVGWTNTTLTYNGVAQRPTLKVIYPSSVTINMPTETNGFNYTNMGTNVGEHTVTATLKPDFQKNFVLVATSDTSMTPTTVTSTNTTMKYKINALSISNSAITYSFGTQTYAGVALTPLPTVKLKTTAMSAQSTLVKDTDYTVGTYTGNISAGANVGKVTITGKGNFTGTKQLQFTIEKATLTAVPTVVGKLYDGGTTATGSIALTGAVNGEKPTATGTFAWTSATAGTTTYNVSNITLGSSWTANYKLSATSLNNQSNTGVKIGKVTLTPSSSINNKVYNADTTATGSITLAGAVNGEAPTASGTFAWTSANAGTTTYNVTDIALNDSWGTNYELSASTLSNQTAGSAISKAVITGVSWDIPASGYVYDGTQHSPRVTTVTTTATAGVPADAGDMFTYTYSEQTNQGTHTATAELKAEYASNYEIIGASDKKTVTATYTIGLATITLDALVTAAYVGTYDGKKHKILTGMKATTVGSADNNLRWYWRLGTGTWTEFTSITDANLAEVCEVKENATYEIKVTADNHAELTFTRTVSISPRSLGAGAGAVDGIGGYATQPQYTYDGTSKEFKPVLTDSVTGQNGGKGITSADYSFTYNNNINAGVKTAVLTVTGANNYTGSFQILYTIDPRAISEATITVTGITDTVYNHGAQKESPTLTDTVVGNATLATGTDYTVTYQTSDGAEAADFTNVGTIEVVITGAGNYTGTRTIEYKITPYELDGAGSTATVAGVADQTYTGAEITPEPVVTVTFGGAPVTLVKGADAQYAYTDNRNAGTATITITGAGNYSGSITQTFKITPKEITAISGITADNKVYDGTLTYDNAVKDDTGADAAGIDYSSAVIAGNADGANLTVSAATGEFSDKNAGVRTVTVTVTALGGSASGNYTLASGGVKVIIENVEITAREIVIGWGELEHVYDGKDYKPTAEVQNLVEGDVVTLVTQLKGASSAIAPGPYTVEISVANSTIPANYKLPAVTEILFNITTEGITARVNTDSLTAVYTGRAQAPVIERLNLADQSWSAVPETTEGGAKNYELTFTGINGAQLVDGKAVNAGEYKVTVKLSPNYSWSDVQPGDTREYTFKISPATLTGITLTGKTETYSGVNYELEADWSGVKINGEHLGSQPEGVTVTYLYNGAASGGVAVAGVHTVAAQFTVNGNYNAIPDLQATLTILKAEYALDGADYNLRFEPSQKTVAYDGQKHTHTLSGTFPAGVTVVYAYISDGVNYGSDGVTDVGEYTVRATFGFANASDADNYKLTYGGLEISYLEGGITVGKQQADISGAVLESATVEYDGNVHRLQVTGTSVGVTGVTYEYYNASGASVGADGVRNAGEYTVVAHFTVDGNYAPVSDKRATLTIEKAQLTVSADAKTIVYGDDPSTAEYTLTYTGLAAVDSAGSLGEAVIRVNGGKYSIYGDAGVYEEAIEVSGLASANYEITYKYGTLTVKPRTVTVNWYNDATRGSQDLTYIYEENTVHTPYADVTNAVHGDVLVVKVKGGASVAGMNYLAEAEGVYIIVNGETRPALNYVLPVSGLSTQFDVLPKPPKSGKIIWDNAPLYYNGMEQAPKAYYYADENDNTPTELTVTVNKRAVAVGEYVATVSLGGNDTLEGELSRSYKILARKVYIEIPDMSAMLGAADVSKAEWRYVSGSQEFVSGEQYSITFSTDNISVAGRYAIRGEFTSNNAGNYEVIFTGSWTSDDAYDGKCGTLTVTEGVYDMSNVTYTGLEATYDGASHAIAISGLPVGVTAEAEYVLNGWSLGIIGQNGFAGAVNAGDYEVIIRFTGSAAGYARIPDAVKILKIKKASLIVKAGDTEIEYGAAAETNGVTYSIAGAERELGGTLTLTADYTQYGAAGKYRITASGLTSVNYEISYVPGTLTVKPRTVAVTWYTDSSATTVYNPSKAYDYDGAVHQPYAVASGMLRGEQLTLTVETDGGAKSEAGLNYTARITALSSGNYTVAEADASVKFSIIEKNVVIWDNSELIYDGEAKQPSAWYYDDAGAHGLTDTELLDSAGNVITSAVNAGDYTIRLKSVPDGVTGGRSIGFKILPKQLTLGIGTGELVYGAVSGNLSSLLEQLKNTLNGADGFAVKDGIPVKLIANISDTSAVGVYAVTGESADANGNYALTFTAGSIEIVKADIDESAIAFAGGTMQSVAYDGKAHGLTLETEQIAGVTRVDYRYYKNGAPVSASSVIDAGEYTVEAVFTVDGNHNAVVNTYTATLTITAKTNADITLENGRAVYNGAEHSLYASGDMTGVTKVTYTYNGASVSGVTEAGTYTVVAHFEVAANYTPIADKNATLTIEKARLTVTASNGATVYGSAASETGYGYTVTGLAVTDSAETVLGALNYSYNYTAGDSVGGYTISVTGAASSDNYTITYKPGKLTVTPRTLTAEDIEWLDKRNGSSLPASGRFSYVYASGEYRCPYAQSKIAGLEFTVTGGAINAGYGYEAEISGITGAMAGNYKLPATGLKVSYDVLPQPLNGNIVWDDTPLYYNGEKQVPKVWYYDENGTRYEFEEVTVSADSVNAGRYTARVSIADINYTLTGETEHTYEILPREVYIEIGDMQAEYGAVPSASAVSYKFINNSGFVAGEEYTVTFTFGTVTGVGEYAISGAFTSANAGNYKVTFSGSYASADASTGTKGTLKVVKAEYDMSKVTFAGTEAVYNGAAHKLTVNGLPEGVTAYCEYVKDGFVYPDGAVNAGKYTVTITFTGDDNHEAVSGMTATLTVNKASLTIKANDSVIIYGESARPNGVTYTGFMGADNETKAGVLTGGLEYSYDYTQGGNAGKYTITPYGYGSANYDITYKTGTLTVTPKTITVTWYDDETLGSQTFVYPNDGKYYAPYAVAGGLVNGDRVELTVDGAKNAQGFNYVATAVLNNGNYALPTDGSATQKFTITPRAGSIVWDNTPLYYNGLSQTPKAYYFDAQGAPHEITGVSVYNASEAVNAGSYTATVVFDGEARYCPFEILPLEIYIEIGSPSSSVPYGVAPVLDQSLWSYAPGSAEFVTGSPVRLETTAKAGSAVGVYAITGVCTDNNYKVTFVEGVLKISKATIDISGVDYGQLTVAYDGSEHRLNITNLPAGIASAVCTYEKGGISYGANGVRDAGEYSVTVRFTVTDASNYNAVGDITVTFTVTALTPDITGIVFGGETKTVTYNGTAQSILATGSADGITGVTYTYYEADGATQVLGNKAVDAGEYKVKAEFTFGANYDGSGISAQWATLKIEKAALTVTADNASVTYGDAVDTGLLTYTVTGLSATDSAEAVIGSAVISVPDYSVTDNAGEYLNAVAVSGNATHKNYTITYNRGALTVTPREIKVVSWQKSKTDASAVLEYEYDGTEHIPYAVAGNTANGDGIELKVEVAKASAGTDYLATVTAVINADGTVNANYTLAADAGERQTAFTVSYATDVPYEIIWNYSAQYYDNTAKKPSAEYYDSVTSAYVGVNPANIEIYSLDGATKTQAIHAGKYIARVTLNDGNTYTNTETEFEVLRRKVYITVGDAESTYGTAHDLSAVGWTYAVNNADNKFLAGDRYTITLGTTATIYSDTGKYPVKAEYAGSADYDVTFTGGSFATSDEHNGEWGTLTVNKAVYDMSRVTIDGLTAEYSGAAHTAEAKNLPFGVTANYSYSRGGWSYADGAVNAGEYTVTVTFAGNSNYEPIADMTATLTITKARLTVTANAHSIVYGDAPEAGGVSYAGFKGADNENKAGVLGGALSYEYGYTLGGNAGEYPITPKGLTAANYEITYVSGILTVEKRTVTVNWFNDERMNSMTLKYPCDGNTYLPYAEAGNVIAGDSVLLTVTGAQSAAGIGYIAKVTSVSNANYKLPADGSSETAFDIVPGAYIIVWESAPFVYDNKPHAPKAYYFTANGERVELNVTVKAKPGDYTSSAGLAIYAGEYTAVASLAGGNVTLTGEWEHKFTIEKRKVTVVINDASGAYGGDVKFNGWHYGEDSAEFVSGAPVYLTSEADKASKVGVYAITGVYAGTDDSYDVTFVNGTYTVTKAVVTAPEINGKVYTGGLLKADVTDTAAYRVYQNDGGVNVGYYKVILELLDYENYKWQADGVDLRSANYTVMFEVIKAENSFTAEFAVREIKAGQTIDIVQPAAEFGNAVVEYYKDAACAGEKVDTSNGKWNEVEGTYYAKVTVAGTDNYGGLERIYTFTVTGKLELDVYWGELTHGYDGTAWAPKAYVRLDGREIELVVTGAQTNADVYNASVTLTAKDGTDLSKYAFSGGSETAVRFAITPKEITVRIQDMHSVYGDAVQDVNLWNFNNCVIEGGLVGADNRVSLNLNFYCSFGSDEFAKAGRYAIYGSCGNKNYNVTFVGADGSAAGTYTVEEAEIRVLKNGTTWFDEQGVIDGYQGEFIVLGATNPDGTYKYLNIKGGQTAKITYSTFTDKYKAEVHDGMTEAQVMMMFADGGTETKPVINRGGSWVVYYRIEADNHTAKYGIWKVLIEDPDDFVIITFTRPYKVQYGDVVFGRNILPELVEQGCFELSGKVVPDIKALLNVAEAYAYEDVQNEVNAGTGVDKYAIRLNFNETGLLLYGDKNFKYSNSNEPGSDTNLNKFEVTRRNVTVNWANTTLTANGEVQLPDITITGFVGGQSVTLTDFTVGVPQRFELDNGDIINVTVLHTDGDSTMTNGSYTLKVVIDNGNYLLNADSKLITLNPAEPDKPTGVKLPTWAIIAIAAGGALLLFILIIVIVASRKRKTVIIAAGDNDGFSDDYYDN